VHLDFTVHFWPALAQLAAIAGGAKFLWACYAQFRDLAAAMKTMVNEHHEMYGWYQRVKGKLE